MAAIAPPRTVFVLEHVESSTLFEKDGEVAVFAHPLAAQIAMREFGLNRRAWQISERALAEVA